MFAYRQVLALGCVALALAGCRGRPRYPIRPVVVLGEEEPKEPNDEPMPPSVAQWLAPKPLVNRVNWVTPACVERAKTLVGQMTLAEKIGQMTQPDRGQLMNIDEV